MEGLDVDEPGLVAQSRYVKASAERAHSNWPEPRPLSVLAGLHRRVDLARLDHEPLGCVPDVLKRKAGDQREVGIGRRIENPQVLRVHNKRTADFVSKVAVLRGQLDVVADSNPLERPEQPIAVRGQCAVPGLPRQRSIWKIA